MSRTGAKAVQFVFYFSLTYFILVWYSCYQSFIYLRPDREFPVQGAAFIVPNVVTTLLLQIYPKTCDFWKYLQRAAARS